MKRIALLASFILALTGCVTTQQSLVNGRLSPEAGQGVAIFSFTAHSEDANDSTAGATMEISGPDGKNTYFPIELGTNEIPAPGGMNNSAGRLFVKTLPAGNYTISRIDGNWQPGGGFSRAATTTQAMNVPFEIKSGEVVYLGNVDLMLNYDKNVQFSGNDYRDYYALQKQYGVQDLSNIKQRLLVGPSQF